ncbi:MAG: chemotaxis protein CheW [Rhodospirillaceae bacterium]|jgi:purine-binding chemotaxis protein CheW|nr:chemotaxis protein CheW [Rhodospirillaceae bacterium]MBT5245365.1 chemotaxis protein CheW [Rhodospirillaceae bacterium]MBT5562521.1 chemotaxis protein CheW [Rhodospirillaceae bacterium]MBT6242906.1 chemotaxis protein CheW [Rhodospirillaceae bacterium]
MNQALATTSGHDIDAIGGDNLENFVTFTIKDQMFGIPVLQVQDILTPTTIASVPLAPPEVKGSINLRGRIVTVIDVRVRLGLGKQENPSESMGVTIEHNHELYTLLVDKVGDVVGLASDLYESNPGTLDSLWREFASGVFRLEGKLMVVLDVERLLGTMKEV